MNHPALVAIKPEMMTSSAGFMVNGIGQVCRVKHDIGLKETSERLAGTEYLATLPWAWLHDEIFEWIAVGEAVNAAREKFTMVELGAGFGRWIVAAEIFARRTRPGLSTRLIGIEAERTHYEWMIEHFSDNRIDTSNHRLIEAAIALEDGEVIFAESGDSGADYGAHIVYDHWDDTTRPLRRKVKAVSLSTLLADERFVDLLHSDIQAFERSIVPAFIRPMTEKVKRAYISTHEPVEIETEVSTAFRDFGWDLVAHASANSVTRTEFGEITTRDGYQYWVNPNLEA